MKRINERPSYILTASRSEMIVSVETPCPATVRVKVPAISAMAGARFVVNIDGTDFLPIMLLQRLIEPVHAYQIAIIIFLTE